MPGNYTEHNLIEFQKSFPDDDSCAKASGQKGEEKPGFAEVLICSA